MPAFHIKIGNSAHGKEADGLDRICAGLPNEWIMLSNIPATLVPPRRGRAAKEIDCFLIGTKACFLIDLKSHSGSIQAYNSRPWEKDGKPFQNRNGKEVESNKGVGFYENLMPRMYECKDLLEEIGIETRIEVCVVFTSDKAKISNPSGNCLARNIDEFVSWAKGLNRRKSKPFDQELLLELIQHFTEGDKSKWPPRFKKSEVPGVVQAKEDERLLIELEQLRAEKKQWDSEKGSLEARIGELTEELRHARMSAQANMELASGAREAEKIAARIQEVDSRAPASQARIRLEQKARAYETAMQEALNQLEDLKKEAASERKIADHYREELKKREALYQAGREPQFVEPSAAGSEEIRTELDEAIAVAASYREELKSKEARHQSDRALIEHYRSRQEEIERKMSASYRQVSRLSDLARSRSKEFEALDEIARKCEAFRPDDYWDRKRSFHRVHLLPENDKNLIDMIKSHREKWPNGHRFLSFLDSYISDLQRHSAKERSKRY